MRHILRGVFLGRMGGVEPNADQGGSHVRSNNTPGSTGTNHQVVYGFAGQDHSGRGIGAAAGSDFLDWEHQADALRKAVLPTLLQERAALDDTAQINGDECGKCPRCGSDRIYLDHDGQETQKEVISPHGPVVVGKQQCRCRACGRSFSPSGS